MVSYSTGMPGFSPSEWVDEKLAAARQLGHFVILITSASSQLQTCQHQRIIKLASLSGEDFAQETKELENHGAIKPSRGLILNSMGRAFDLVFKALAGSRSDGRWSWAIPATLAIWVSALRFHPDEIVATGGPSSAQFAASLASLFPGCKRPVLEFQDPFIGREMGLSVKVLQAMHMLNRFMMSRAKKYVAVSKGSLAQIQEVYPKYAAKVTAIYPYAGPRVFSNRGAVTAFGSERAEFLHAGTLYGTRNLRPLFEALDAGYADGKFSSKELQVTNLGADYTGTEARHDYQELALLPRDAALDRARQSQVLLLVQHADDRSLETIPFKLYDYLNLGVPILVIGRNPEIMELLSHGDFFCYVENQQSIVQAVSSLLNSNRPASDMRSFGAVELSRPAPDSYVKAWEALVA
jgi:hypothetical protein